MRLKEFCEKTGTNPRQLRYWQENGMDVRKVDPNWKPGMIWECDEALIPRVKLLAQLAKECRIPVGILNVIFWMYDTGWAQISGPPNGIRIEWDLET